MNMNITLHYVQIYNAPYMSIRKQIWSAGMQMLQYGITTWQHLHNLFNKADLQIFMVPNSVHYWHV